MSIVATSQQSRFNTETLETLAKDVDLKQLNVSIGDKELIVDAQLQLFAGVHYGLIGRNGTGKSTLLKAMGYGLVVGFPKSVKVLYVDQLEGIAADKAVVDIVVESDKEGECLQQEVDLLQHALELGSPDHITVAVRKVNIGRLECELAEATEIATKRSGLRGLQARGRQVELEGIVEAARKGLRAKPTEDELLDSSITADSMLEELYDKLEALDMESAESRARAILKGLGFDEKMQDGPFSQLSGGWRMRVALAQALYIKPGILLLDEPTNHLDLPAILWLQSYIQSLTDTTLLIVSHDRSFLNATIDEVMVLRKQGLEYYTGNYDQYVTARDENQLFQERLQEKVDKKRRHIEESIQNNLRQAKKAGDDKRLGMVASRKKKLDRLGNEKNEHGHRFRLQKDMVGFHDGVRGQANAEAPDPKVTIKFPPPSELRHKGSLVQLEDVSFSYTKGHDILRGVTLNIESGARLALIGANGGGKSTAMKLIASQSQPTRGTVSIHREAVLGVFMQHQVEQLIADMHNSALSFMMKAFPGIKEQDMRAHLGSLGIKGALATQPLTSLSGGQAVRVALAHAVYPGPHILILDEPTNHLDMDTIAALIEALKGYKGAVVLVSHDQFMVQEVADKVYLMKDQKLVHLEKGVQEYVKMITKKKKKTGKP